MISDNKGLQKRLGIDARVAQDWASSQLVKHRRNREALGAVENMYANKISGTTQGILGLRQQNAQLRTQKVKKKAWWEGAVEGGLQGAGMVASLYGGGVLGGAEEATKVGGGSLVKTPFDYVKDKLVGHKPNANIRNDGNIGFDWAKTTSDYAKGKLAVRKPYDPMTALGSTTYKNPIYRALYNNLNIGVSNVR